MNLKEEMLQIVSEATHSQYSARTVDYIITKPVFQGTQFRDSTKIPKTSTYNLLSNLVTKKNHYKNFCWQRPLFSNLSF